MDPMINPNLNGDVYRSMTAADRPPAPDKHLQFISIFNGTFIDDNIVVLQAARQLSDNSAILGGSNLTDRYWGGTIWYYNDISDFDRNKALVATKTDSGACCGGYLDRDKFLIGEDSGVLQILAVADAVESQTQQLQCLGYTCQHDDSLTALSVFPDKSSAVTCGADYCIKVWNLADLMATRTYGFAHTNIITSVDAHPTSDRVFVSTSLDCEALIWDSRQSEPARSIFKRKGLGLTTATWNPCTDNIVAMGAVDGSVMLVDLRNENTTLCESIIFPRAVHKLLFDPDQKRSERLAGCCDGTVVKAIDTSKELSPIIENDDHRDFVRGLAWCNGTLFSCSWDDRVLKHTEHVHHSE